MYFISQIQNDDCGFANLKMLLAIIQKDKDYLYLPQDEYHGSYSYLDLVTIAKEYDVSLSAVSANKKETIASCDNFPLIATISLQNDAKHAVVVTAVKHKKVYYLDPREGSGVMKLNLFIKKWDGTCLLVENFKEKKCPFKPIKPIPAVSKFLLSFFQVLSIVLAVTGVYFIDDATPLYVPTIFISLAIFFEIMMKVVSTVVMKRLDKFFFSEKNLPRRNVKTYLQRFEEYKKYCLSSPLNFVITLVFMLGIVAVVLLNDINNGFLILVPVTLVVFHHLAILPKLKKISKNVEEIEETIDSSKDRLELQNRIDAMHKEAYRYGRLSVVSQYSYAMMIIVATIFTMYISGISSFPYIIFYTFVSIMIYRSLDIIFSYSEKIKEFNKVKVKLGNSMNRRRENVSK